MQQSGQSYICKIYTATHRLTQAGNRVCARWALVNGHVSLMEKAKATARQEENLSTQMNDSIPVRYGNSSIPGKA